MQRRVVLTLALLLCLPAMAQATVTIIGGIHNLNNNQAGQIVDVLITADAGENVNAMDAFFRINNNVAGAPFITAINVSASPTMMFGAPFGATFANYPTPFRTSVAGDNGLQASRSGLSTANPDTGDQIQFPIPTSGIFARLTISTAGIFGGTYALDLANGLGNSQYADLAGPEGGTLVPGLLILPSVPEPSTVVLGLFAMAGLGMVAIRKHRARRAA